jgi:hypothetical protein
MRIGEKPEDMERKDALGGIKRGWEFLCSALYLARKKSIIALSR